jgi:hypothetical protein
MLSQWELHVLRKTPLKIDINYYKVTQFHPAPGSDGHHNCIKCTKADVRLRTPDDGKKGCPKHVES